MIGLATLVLAALALSSCTTPAKTPVAAPTRVLGEQSTSATVLGQPAPAGTGDLGAVACADAMHCWAVGIAGPNAPAPAPPATTTTTAPTATGTPTTTTTPPTPVTVIAATVNGGQTWTAQPLTLAATPELSGIACPTTTDCMAVGSTGAVPGAGVVLTSRNGGASWGEASVPTGAFVLTAVQCQGLSLCTAVLSDGTNIWSARTSDFGHTWVPGGLLPVGFSEPRSISCTPAGLCLVPGYTPTSTGHGQGAIALSADGGTTWAAAAVPTGAGVLQGATCLTALSCVAVGTTSTTVSDIIPADGLELISTDGGHTWISAPAASPVDDIYGIDCPTAKVCAIVGTRWLGTPTVGTGAVAHSTDGGATFIRSSTAYVPLTLTAVSCPTAAGCVAVGGDTVARITLPTPAVAPAAAGRVRGPPR